MQCRVLAGDALAAQESPFLPEPVYRALVNEMSGDIAYEHIRWFTHYHRPMGGSEGFEAVAKYVEEKAREYGLEDVRYIPLKYLVAQLDSAAGRALADRADGAAPRVQS